MPITYTLTDADKYATLYKDGRIVGTLTRPRVIAQNKIWTVSNRDGVVVMTRRLCPTKAAMARALGL